MSWAKSLGAGRARRQIEDEIGALGDADLLADQIIDLEPKGERLGRIGRPGGDGKDHLILIAEGIEAEEGEAAGNRPGHIGAGEIGRSGPIQADRNAGIARRAPIGLPAGRQLELQPQRHRFGAAAAGDGGDQPELGLGAWRPNRRPQARQPARSWRTRPGRPWRCSAGEGPPESFGTNSSAGTIVRRSFSGRHKLSPAPHKTVLDSAL